MKLAAIFEGQEDFRYQAEAKELAHSIGRWVAENNAETPIKDLFYKRALPQGTVGYIKNVGAMGIDGYDDLNFGFVDGGGTEAYMATGTDEGRRVYFVFVRVPDVGDKVDVMYSMRWEHLIHEFTHYIDRKRSQTSKKSPNKSAEDYYNSPMEFNAYFHQGLYKLSLAFRKGVPEFPEFLRQAQIEFDGNWRDHMTPETRRRFLRRLHGVWQSLKSRASEADA